jgi:hypothetical protein
MVQQNAVQDRLPPPSMMQICISPPGTVLPEGARIENLFRYSARQIGRNKPSVRSLGRVWKEKVSPADKAGPGSPNTPLPRKRG